MTEAHGHGYITSKSILVLMEKFQNTLCLTVKTPTQY